MRRSTTAKTSAVTPASRPRPAPRSRVRRASYRERVSRRSAAEGERRATAPEGVLLTRLVPPRLPPGCLARPALVERIRTGLGGRITAVLAGAGYGKSTALRLALSDIESPVVWCTLDSRVRDSRALVAHLAAGMGGIAPGFGSRLELAGPPERQVGSLANEVLETVPDDIVLVLDDVHTLPEDAAEALGLLVSDLPGNVHFAMAGRAPLPLSVGARRLAGVRELGERDLALAPSETATLVEAARPEATPGDIARIHEATEGWVAGVVLAAGASEQRLGHVTAGGGDLFAYLAEEVLAAQDAELAEFLERTAVLDRFTPRLAESLTGRADADRICRLLVDRHLFTARLDAEGEWFRYHQLFQGFLLERARERGIDEAELHVGAARAWAEAGEPLESVRHWLLAGAHDDAVDALEPIAEGLLMGPDSGMLSALLEELPEDRWSDRPSLVLADATLRFHRGRLGEAFAALERAMAQLIEAGEHERAATAYFQLITLQMVMGTPQERGVGVGRRWLPMIDPETTMLPLGVIMMASEAGCACHYEEAAAGLAHALSLPKAGASPILTATAETMRALFVEHPSGRSEEALVTMGASIATLEEHSDDDQLGFVTLALILRALVQNNLGRYDGALADARSASDILSRRGAGPGFERVLGKLRAVALAGLRQWDDLETELRAAEPPERLLGSNYAFRLAAPRARLAAHRGDVEEVERQIDFAERAIAAYGFSFDTPTWLCDLGEAAFDVALIGRTRELHARATEAASRARTPWSRTRADLVGALAFEGTARGDELLAAALERTRSSGYAAIWTARDRPYAARLLSRAIEAGLGPEGEAEELLARCAGEVLEEAATRLARAEPPARLSLARAAGRAPEPSAALLDRLLRDRDAAVREAARAAWTRLRRRPRASLRIRSLGRLRVERDGVEVPDSAFGRQRARQLLGLLVARLGPIAREEVVAALWPDLSSHRGAAALRTTLHELRRALQPEIAPDDAASVIAADSERIELRLGPRDALDLAELRALGTAADASLDARLGRIEAADAVGDGEFLAEWPYEEWALAPREEVAALRARLLVDAAEALAAAERHQEAAFLYQRLLRSDPLAESWHLGLMRAYAGQGDRSRALRQYHACRTILRRELGVEPSEPLRDEYATVLGVQRPAHSLRQRG